MAQLLAAGRMPPVIQTFTGRYIAAEYLHECSDGYRQLMPFGAFCGRCGWAPDLPLPELDRVYEQMRATMDCDDALVFVTALVGRIREGRW